MSNVQLRNSIIAIVVGAIVAILQKIAEAYIVVPPTLPTDIAAPIVAGAAYLKLMAKVIV